jgi:two-component system sensor histidine kinase ArlS
MKLTLKSKILIWFVIIIIISFILYGFLIYFVYSFNLRGEKYMANIAEHIEDVDRIVLRLREKDDFGLFLKPPDLTILSPGLFMRIFYTITGGVLLIIITSVSGGFLILRRSLRRVDFITKNVKEIDDKRLHLRLNLKGKDPISNMARVFDTMLDKIEASFKNQKQFIQNVSHELNTPLTVMKTKIDILKQKKNVTKKEYREAMEILNSEIIRLSGTTEELLTLSELEENGSKKEFVRINAKEVLNKIIKLFENRIDSKNLDIKTKVKGDSVIAGSRLQIEQLFFNLIDNAVKYSVPQKNLTISLRNDRSKRRLIFDITNVNKLIKKEDLPHIFDRFYKTYTVKDKKGYGLGLSISKKIVENHKGKIRAVYNSRKKEITFKVTLPIYREK